MNEAIVSVRRYNPPGARGTSHYRLYSVRLDSRTLRPLTDDAVDSTAVSVVPDSGHVLFLRAGALCRMDADGGPIQVLYRPDRAAVGASLSLIVSPDGQRVALQEALRGGVRRVLIYSLKGPLVRILTGADDARWESAERLRCTVAGKRQSVDVLTGFMEAAKDEPQTDGAWRVEVGVDDDTKLMLVAADGSGRAIPFDPAAKKALADNDRDLASLQHLQPIPGDRSRLWLHTFHHRAYKSVHLKLDPATAQASLWFVSVGPARISPDGKWLVTYPIEAYSDYGKGKRVETRNLYRTPAAKPGAWTPLFPGLVHIDSFGLR